MIAIIGVLASLLLPAVQAAREAGRRASCTNNLRQLGVALQNFHDANLSFPPGRGGPPPRIFSPQAYLLPHVEEGSLQGQIDLTQAPTTVVVGGVFYSGAYNKPAASEIVPVLQCPSDVTDGRVPGSDYGATNYAANTGSGMIDSGTIRDADGVFYYESKVAFKNLLDGSSHTAAFSERMLGNGVDLAVLPAAEGALYILELNSSSPVSVANCQSAANGDGYGARARSGSWATTATRSTTTAGRRMPQSGTA